MKKALSHLLFFLVPLCCLHAQAPSAATTPDVSFRFRLYAWGAKLPPLGYGDNHVVEALDDDSMSSIQTYSGPPRINFTRVTAKPDPRKPLPVLASILIPENMGQATVLTAPIGHGHYAMYLIPADPAALPPGRALLHNVSTKRLLVVCNGSRQIQMEPGASTQVSGSGKAVVVQVAAWENDRWAALFNNVIQLDPRDGSNVLFIGGQGGSAIGMIMIPAWPKSPPAPKTASD